GLTAASVWMNRTYESSGNARDLALTMPEVTVFSNPNGWPIATTQEPTLVSPGSPVLTAGRFFASIFNTAMSVVLSTPSTLAVNSRLSVSLTLTLSAPSTTCALVSTMPLGSMMKPEPTPRVGPCRGIWKLRKNWRNSGGRPCMSGALSPSSCPRTLRLFEITLMLTTAGPYCSTSALKSGSAAVGAALTATVGAAGFTAGTTAANAADGSSRSAATPPSANAPAMATATALRFKILACIVVSCGKWPDIHSGLLAE